MEAVKRTVLTVLSVGVLLHFGVELALSAVEDIESMEVRGDRHFDVYCADGSGEIVSARDIRNDHVCGEASSAQVICTSYVGQWYPTSLVDGRRMGQGMSREMCRELVDNASDGVVCTEYVGQYSPTIIRTHTALGQGMGFDQCLYAVGNIRRGLVCRRYVGQYYLTVIRTGQSIGGGFSALSDCVGSVDKNLYFRLGEF